MADGVFNIARGKVRYYLELPAAADALVVVLLQTTGLQVDDTLRDHDNLSVLLAASNDEATFTGYARKVISTAPTVAINDTLNRLDADTADITWVDAGGPGLTNNTLSKMIVTYRPDTASADTAIIPLTYHDFLFDPLLGTPVTTDGDDMVAVIALDGFYRSA